MSVLGVIAQLLAGCAWTPVAPYVGDAPREEVIYLIAGDWHTEIGMSRKAASDLPPSLLRRFPEAQYLVFGWGERGYYTARDPGLGDVLRALAPGPAALLIVPLVAPPAQTFGAENVLALPVSQPGIARLSAYLWDYIAKDADGMPLRVEAAPDSGSVFYASAGDYSIAHTCNTWTAEALHVAGLPVDAGGVVFAGQVLRQARPLAIGHDAPDSAGTQR